MRLLTRRRFLFSAAGAAAGALAYTAFVEPFWTEVVHQRISFASLPAGLRGFRFVQLSDLHIGPQVAESYLRRCFATVTALRPDLVLYTGDFITVGRGTYEGLVRLMPQLPKGRLGALAVLGNHDYGFAWKEAAWAQAIVRLAGEAGIRVLRNEVTHVQGLQIAGLDDLWAGQAKPRETLRQLDRDAPAIVLSHNPDSADAGDWRGYRGWILSGHTHGGQCKPPFLPPPLLPVKNRRYTAGVIPLSGGRTLYINRGLGHLLQARFNVRPEITVFTVE